MQGSQICRLLGRHERNVFSLGIFWHNYLRFSRGETMPFLQMTNARTVAFCGSQGAVSLETCFLNQKMSGPRLCPLFRCRSDLTTSYLSSTRNAEKWSSDSLIEAWFTEVNPFGTLTVHNFPFKVYIYPLNPADYPKMNKSVVKMYYNNECDQTNAELLSGRKLSELGKVYEMNVSVYENGEKIFLTCKQPAGVMLPVVCQIFLPIRFAINIVSDQSVSISDMQSDTINIHLLKGDCLLKGVKCGAASVRCDNGSITSQGYLLGCIQLQCGKQGKIIGERLQGTSVVCQTNEGDLDIKMLYAKDGNFSSESGEIKLGGCHGNIVAKLKRGNLTVGSLDGSLCANLESGSADVFVARSEKMAIDTKQGNVTLKLPDTGNYSFDLNATVVETDDTLSMNVKHQRNGFPETDSGSKITVTALQGKIVVKADDWLSSVKLRPVGIDPYA